ncbi:MAG: DUF503 domain-containing protein [Candidatus Jettenia sp. AMX1]|nr:MAG: DUF503 domain-containing protein [Candidatus Jettenia sp. AMX1]
MNLEFYKSNDTVIGIVNIRLVIRSANTLKDKRRIIFNVSIAETGSLDHCQYSQIGIAMVGNDNRYVNSVLSNLINLIRCANSVELVDYKLEFV